MSKVTLSGYIIVPSEEVEAVRKALPEHIELTRAEEGCIVFQVNEDPASQGRFDVYEEFFDPDAFRSHQARVKESNWGRVSANASRHYSITGLEE